MAETREWRESPRRGTEDRGCHRRNGEYFTERAEEWTIGNIGPAELFKAFHAAPDAIDQVHGWHSHRQRRWMVMPGIERAAGCGGRATPHGEILTGHIDSATIDAAQARTPGTWNESCQFALIIIAGRPCELAHLLE